MLEGHLVSIKDIDKSFITRFIEESENVSTNGDSYTEKFKSAIYLIVTYIVIYV